MSIPVELSDLAATVARYRYAYLMTSSDAAAPHAVAVDVVVRDGELVIESFGRRTRDNALARPMVGLVWPPQDEDGYSLIVDGHATFTEAGVSVEPGHAILHRPAEDGTGHDCLPLDA